MPPLTPAQQQALGLRSFTLGAPESIALPATDVALGKGAAPAISLMALLATGCSGGVFAPVPSEKAAASGITLGIHDDQPQMLLAESGRNTLLVGTVGPDAAGKDASGEAESHGYLEDSSFRVLVDLSRGPVRLSSPGGSEILVCQADHAIEIWPLEAPSADLTLSEISEDAPDLAAWAQSADENEDSWLADTLREHAGRTDAWSRIVGTGLAARLPEARSPEAARSIIARAIAGELSTHVAPPHAWAATLSEEAKNEILRSMLVHAEQLQQEISALRIEMDFDDPAWCDRVRVACVRRDDLEGLRPLMREVGRGDEVVSILARLDQDGDTFEAVLPGVLQFDDERLRRAARQEGPVWWARFASGA